MIRRLFYSHTNYTDNWTGTYSGIEHRSFRKGRFILWIVRDSTLSLTTHLHRLYDDARTCGSNPNKNACIMLVSESDIRLANRHTSVHVQRLPVFIYTYKRAVCVCLSVCLLFIGHTTFVHFAALPPSGREQDQPSSRAALRARASACTARARARMPYNFSTKKSLR